MSLTLHYETILPGSVLFAIDQLDSTYKTVTNNPKLVLSLQTVIQLYH